MKLKDLTVGPPGGWSIKCPRCSGKHFAGATFAALIGSVTRHYVEAGHPLSKVQEEAEDELCKRVSGLSPAQITHSDTIMLLGRYGDIVNLLPFAYHLSRKRREAIDWIVSDEFADIFADVSYVRPLKWNGNPDSLPDAIHATRDSNPRIAQCWRNPDQRHLTTSFCKESWRLAGGLEDFGRWPLVFDRRDRDREAKLLEHAVSLIQSNRPSILVSVDSVSSPYTNGPELVKRLETDFPGAVLDLRKIKAENPADLLVLIENADVLVTVDTLHLHLARACNTPVIALLNQGWLGSVVPPQTTAWFVYNIGVGLIARTVRDIITCDPKNVIVTYNPHGNTDRHSRAQATWPCGHISSIHRDARSIGDVRDLPFARDILQSALDKTTEDVIIYTNSDVSFHPHTIPTILEHARRFQFGCSRRDAEHIGREIFWFTRDWLANNIQHVPDVIWGAPKPDLIWCRWMRSLRGIPTNYENLMFDFPPVELPAGLVYHEPHRSAWLEHQWSPAAQHNEKLWLAI